MLNWSSAVPEKAIKHGYDIIRTPTDGKLKVYILSTDMLGCYTHWFGGRTVPCTKPRCPACDAGTPSRWHAYLAVWDPKTREISVFETTAQAAKQLEHYRNTFHTLRGCAMTAARPKRRRNAKIQILTAPADLTKINLPAEIDVIRALSIIWQIPYTAMGIQPTGRTSTQVHHDPDVTQKLDDPADPKTGDPQPFNPQELQRCVSQN